MSYFLHFYLGVEQRGRYGQPKNKTPYGGENIASERELNSGELRYGLKVQTSSIDIYNDDWKLRRTGITN